MLRWAASALASVLAVASTQVALVPEAYLAPGSYAGVELAGYTARDPQPLYSDALSQACARAARVDKALTSGPAAGNGVLLGTTDGRVVVSESIREFADARAARRFVTAARSSAACLVYGGRDSFTRVFAQYPQLPPLPEIASGVERSAATTSTTFRGTSEAAPLAGTTALLAWDRFVAETSIRIAVPRPGELESLSQAILRAAEYDARSVTGAGADAKVAGRADAVAERLLARTGVAQYGLEPSPRTGIPSNPASCTAATDAFVYSGIHGAVRGYGGTDAATGITARPEVIVFPKEADAREYFDHFADLSTCLTDLYTGAFPGSTVEVERFPRRGVQSARRGVDRVAYIATVTGPDGAGLGEVGVEVLVVGDRAAYLLAQVPSAGAGTSLRAGLEPLVRDLSAALAG